MTIHKCLSAVLVLIPCLSLLFPAYADNKPEPLVKVTARPLAGLLIRPQHSAPATVISLNHALLGAEIAGRVRQIRVKVGDQVSQGDTLLQIDCRDYTLAQQQASAALQAARARQRVTGKQYNRNKKLRNNKTIPENILEESELQWQLAQADVSAKQAALEQAQLAVERCTIKAPFSGQITRRLVSVGQLLAPHSGVFELLQTDRVEVQAQLTTAELEDMRQAPGRFFVAPGLRVPLAIRAVVQRLETDSKTRQVRLQAMDASPLLAGQTGRLHWQGSRGLLPADYLLRRQGKLGVMWLEPPVRPDTPAHARFHALPQAREGQPAVIDLPGNTLVIDTNRFRVQPDQPVHWLSDSPAQP